MFSKKAIFNSLATAVAAGISLLARKVQRLTSASVPVARVLNSDAADCDNADLDVVLVHGFLGDSEGTWQSASVETLWPVSLLADESNGDLSSVRVVSLQYSLRPLEWSSKPEHTSERKEWDETLLKRLGFLDTDGVDERGLLSHADEAVRALGALDVGKERPVAFIAHSMGGPFTNAMLTAAELRMLEERNDEPTDCYQHILRSTVGVVFLASPLSTNRDAVTMQDVSLFLSHLTAGPGWGKFFMHVVGPYMPFWAWPGQVSSWISDQNSPVVAVNSFAQMRFGLERLSFGETRPMSGVDFVVPRTVADACGERHFDVDHDHSSISKEVYAGRYPNRIVDKIRPFLRDTLAAANVPDTYEDYCQLKSVQDLRTLCKSLPEAEGLVKKGQYNEASEIYDKARETVTRHHPHDKLLQLTFDSNAIQTKLVPLMSDRGITDTIRFGKLVHEFDSRVRTVYGEHSLRSRFWLPFVLQSADNMRLLWSETQNTTEKERWLDNANIAQTTLDKDDWLGDENHLAFHWYRLQLDQLAEENAKIQNLLGRDQPVEQNEETINLYEYLCETTTNHERSLEVVRKLLNGPEQESKLTFLIPKLLYTIAVNRRWMFLLGGEMDCKKYCQLAPFYTSSLSELAKCASSDRVRSTEWGYVLSNFEKYHGDGKKTFEEEFSKHPLVLESVRSFCSAQEAMGIKKE